MSIENISDTARWVAEYRAMETDRPDAIFRDPFARRLAGPKGAEIVNLVPSGRRMAWAMIVRTAVFDELLMERIRAGADLVINLAAGLDARPWRLDLPASLRWVDVDLPAILQHKVDELRGEKTRCRYEPVMLDLRDEARRAELFRKLGGEHQNVVVLTEGLLIYLDEAQVAALATALAVQPSFRSWIIDIASPMLLQWSRKSWGKTLDQGNAPFRFAPQASTAFFEPYGWREAQFRSTGEEGQRLNREMKGMWFWRFVMKVYPRRYRDRMKRFAGVALLERA